MVTLGLGFRPYLLSHLKNILLDETPQYKIEPIGFLNFLSKQSRPTVLRLDTSKGHQQIAQIKYKQRYTKDFTSTQASCDETNTQSYRETSVDLTSYRQIAIHVEDEIISKYEDTSSDMIMAGLPATPIMNEFLEEIMNAASAILEGVNEDLQTVASLNIGINARTGNANATPININRSSLALPLDDGLTEILTDYSVNMGMGEPQVFGSGLFYNFMLQQKAKSANFSGYNTAIEAAGMKFYHDLQTATIFGANQIIVCQPNSLQWIEYMQFTGFKAGIKPGASQFFTLPLPVQIDADVLPILFDVQLRYNDCATVFTDAYYGTQTTLQKGYNLIISKTSGLFTIPKDAYRGTDRLVGNRGTLLYEIENVCDNCETLS